MPTRVLVLTDDRPGPAMAGPAIRAVELARALAPVAHITLASTQPAGPLALPGVEVVTVGADLLALARAHDVLVAGGLFFAQHPALWALDRATVLDLYAPFLLEDRARLVGPVGTQTYARHHHLLGQQMARADFMLCASERQRDYYLGRLCALGRLGVGGDATARRLLEVVPFGLPATPPAAGAPLLRQLPGVSAESKLFVWGGGLWDWLDPLTPLEALAEAVPEAHLVYWAGRSPNPTTPRMTLELRARERAAELGSARVHFLDSWLPYAERGSALLEADAGLMAHEDSLESRFAYRTRALDYLWAARPILCTRGDAIAELVEREGLGLTIAPGDVAGWRAAFARVARDPDWVLGCRTRLEALRPQFTWELAARPLIDYVQAPWRQPAIGLPPAWTLAGPVGRLGQAWSVWRGEGVQGLSTRLERVRARRRPPGP